MLQRAQKQLRTTTLELQEFRSFLVHYLRVRSYVWFYKFEVVKDVVVDLLYRKRGRYVRPFLHLGTIGLIFLVITVGPVIFARDDEQKQASSGILETGTEVVSLYTEQAEEVRAFRGGEITIHVVSQGETLSTIAQRYGLQVSTLLWENKITEKTPLKPGTELKVLPVDGVRHQVQRGETIYSIAKKYGLDSAQAQIIVDYPFNEFLNDETFELATGQFLMVPEGVPPAEESIQPRIAQKVILTPDAGSVSATGSFRWPTAGIITQRYSFYHKAIDIANRSGGPILAADGGVIIGAGWDASGYGNRVLLDHGNGYITLYGHLSVLQVTAGQKVNRGDVLGQMGSTGRSTGTHLHFEIRQSGALLNPLSYLGGG